MAGTQAAGALDRTLDAIPPRAKTRAVMRSARSRHEHLHDPAGLHETGTASRRA